ncbi:hypothetical protein [uncultured Kordia sp.]|uniref:hypothetical protein n=1 Tax=uncultured Kordia sp. TaxID=507699 RepID=UPI002614FBA0|nr:hypothetical protein [uncultured Kordia sp.]
MLKYIIIFLCFTGIAFSQNQKCELLFKDGTTIEGYASLTKKNRIKFRLDKKSNADIWGSENIQRITFFGFENSQLAFEYVKTRWKRTYELMEVVVDGDIKLYARADTSWIHFPLNVNIGEGSVFQPNNGNISRQTSFTLFLKKIEDEKAILVKIGLFSSWKKKMIAYFNNCPEVTEGIASGEYKYRDMKKLVEDYNIYCAK